MFDNKPEHNAFKDKFPEKWTCLMCDPIQEFDKEEILSHCSLVHDMDDVTWEKLYNRLASIGGV